MNARIAATLSVPVSALALFPLMVTAQSGGNSFTDYANVIESRPLYREVRVDVPRQQCWNEEVVRYENRGGGGYTSYTPEIVGGIIGGVIGNQFGGGSGKEWATGAGAVLGGSIGRDLKNRRYQSSQVAVHDTVQRCKTVHDYRYEEQRDGYRVRYLYDGREFETRMPYDPGTGMRVRVTVVPLDGG